jgi:hypothetical protein
MSECTFYKIERKFEQSRELRADRQVTGIDVVIPFCTHKHSPAPHRIVTKALVGPNFLTCEGKLEKCPLSSEVFQDM